MEDPLKDDGSIPDRRHRRARTAHIPNAASLTRFATAHPNSLVFSRRPEPRQQARKHIRDCVGKQGPHEHDT